MKAWYFIFLYLYPLWGLAKIPETLLVQAKNASQILIEPHKDKLIVQGVSKKEINKEVVTLNIEGSVQIKTPTKNIYVILNSSDKLHIRNFQNNNITVSLKKGDLSIENSTGSFSISLDEGQIKIHNNSGQLKIQSYAAHTQIDQFQGDIDIMSYQSPVYISNSKGFVHLSSFSSAIKLQKLEGDLNYNTHRSNIQLRSYTGSIQGESRSGSIQGSLTPKKVQIESQSGDINLYFQNSKARVEAQSWEGKVFAPKNFYKDRAGGVSQASGFIQGRGTQSGVISLKSRSGNIRIH